MSRDRELREALGTLRVPDEPQAEERSWAVVRAAYADRAPVRRPHRARRLAVVAALGAVVVAVALTPAGAKVADLVSDVVDVGEPDARPDLRALPAAGELLVSSPQGIWIVDDDGSRRLLGDFRTAVWSPHGLYVVAAAGRELVALEPDGTVRWTYTAPGEVHDPRWTGTELDTRIAYRSGNDLRVIAGDGSGESDEFVATRVAAVPPAWRPVDDSKLSPGPGIGPYVLSYLDRRGHVQTVNAETGHALPVTRRDRVRLSAPSATLSPDGSRVASLRFVDGRDELVLSGEHGRDSVLFSARGNLTGPTWSPDARWLLVGWPKADQWLFIQAERPHRVVAFDRISEHFDPGGEGAGRFPRVDGWMLARPIG
jgi:hypothetical protein